MTKHLLMACALALPCALAQESAPGMFKLQFAVHEMEDAKLLSTKNYSLTLEVGGRGQIRLGTKMPIPAGSGVQFIDVGLNLDCRLNYRGNQLGLNTDLDLSSPDTQGSGMSSVPAVRQVRTSASSLLVPGKPATIISADDLTSKKRYELEVTATRLQ